jgi:hypothetical protein
MNILDTHEHKLCFRIDANAPPDYMKRWKTFKQKCESGENELIVEQIKGYCKLKQNKNLPYLNRKEGGMGGGDNKINKQVRFRDYKLWSKLPKYIDNDIIIDRVYNTETEKWTYDELDDLIYAFIKTARYNVQADCVKGCIEMVNMEYGYDSD